MADPEPQNTTNLTPDESVGAVPASDAAPDAGPDAVPGPAVAGFGLSGYGAAGVGADGTPFRRVPPVKPPLLRPRKVRGGIKIPAGDVAAATAWAAQRWLRLMEQSADGPRLVEALDDYARAGQTKRIAFLPGKVDAAIQGRSERPYTTQIAFETFTHEMWDKIVEAMAEGSLYAAKLLANELPSNIEDVFAPLGIKLFPVESAEVRHSCSCLEWRTENGGYPGVLTSGKWCKHICCASYLLAQKLASEPFMVFLMRGLEGQELLERLRQRRVVAGAGLGLTSIYAQRVPGVAEMANPALEESIAQFWDAGPAMAELDLALSPPPVSHPLLRRLGQSPFIGATFPLVGLLASCYDTISQEAKAGAPAVGAESGGDAAEADDEGDADAGR